MRELSYLMIILLSYGLYGFILFYHAYLKAWSINKFSYIFLLGFVLITILGIVCNELFHLII